MFTHLFSMLFRLTLKLFAPMVFQKGQRFTIRDGKLTLGTGVVTDYFSNLTRDERLVLMGGRRMRERMARKAAREAARPPSKKGRK